MESQRVQQHCKLLRLPTVGGQFQSMAQQAEREKRSHIGYLEALLSAEVEDRERRAVERRLKEARLPRIKTLEEFDFAKSRKSRRPRSRSWPRATTSSARNRCC